MIRWKYNDFHADEKKWYTYLPYTPFLNDSVVNSTAKGFSVKGSMTDDSYFNISEIRLSVTSLYIISDAPKYDIIWTENSDVIEHFISEILKYESSVIVSSTEKTLGRTIHTLNNKSFLQR